MSDLPQHSRDFRVRRALNWLPLGLTYATFYMGRYNINVVKPIIGDKYHLNELQLGGMATVGFWTYALSVMFNGPLADRFGGKRAILLGSLGVAALNTAIGLLFFGGFDVNVLVCLTLLYAANSYFQSFGALSVVKVNAPWFHVRERGVFSGLFGIMISSGYWLAFTVGSFILRIFGTERFYMLFLVPAGFVMVMFVVNLVVVRDRPSETGHPDFDTGEAASQDTSVVRVGEILQKVISNPTLRIIALAEFCTGIVRQGLMYNFVSYLVKVHAIPPKSPLVGNIGIGIMFAGIAGGLISGFLSDKVFGSRRPPVAFVFYVLQIPALLVLQYAPTPFFGAVMIAFSCTWIFGVHGMLSGAASVDFGGKRAAATAAGLLDGIAYVGSGCATWGVGYVLKHYGWDYWMWSVVPFSLIGALLMLKVWNSSAQSAPSPAVSAPVLDSKVAV
jgi:OPA family glycerol-3-phosphate transporter-like MFS transporter